MSVRVPEQDPRQPIDAVPAGQLDQRPISPEQQEGILKGRKTTVLCGRPRQASVKELTESVYQDLIESVKASRTANDPKILASKKKELKSILQKGLEKLNAEERDWRTTAKRAGLIFLSLFVVTIPLSIELWSKISEDAYKLKRNLLKDVLLKTVEEFDPAKLKNYGEVDLVKQQSLPIESRESQQVIKALMYRQDPPNEDSAVQPPPPKKIGVLTLGDRLIEDLKRDNISSITIQGNKTPESHKALSTSKKDEEHNRNIEELGYRVMSQMKDSAYGTPEDKKNILNNLFTGFMQARFTPEFEKINAAAKASGHPVTVNIPPSYEWQDMGLSGTTARHNSATIGTEFCTQVAMGICKLKPEAGGESKYQVLMMRNRIPLELMKLPPEELMKLLPEELMKLSPEELMKLLPEELMKLPREELMKLPREELMKLLAEDLGADTSKVTSHTILSQEFATPEEAIAYFEEARTVVDDGSIFNYMLNTTPPPPIVPRARSLPGTFPEVKKLFKRPIARTLEPHEQRRGTIVKRDAAEMQPYIKDDVLRLNQAKVTISNQQPTLCYPTQQGEQGVNDFTNNLVSQLPKETYGTEEQRRNIVHNVLSTFSPNTFAHEMQTLIKSGRSPELVKDTELKGMVAGDTATPFSARVNPDTCVCVGMGVCRLVPLDDNGQPQLNRTRYGVMAVQNTMPTSSMQEDHPNGALNIPDIISKTVISQRTFDTIGGALGYLNSAKFFAEQGTLFEDVGFATLTAPAVEYRDPQAVKEIMLEGRKEQARLISAGNLKVTEDTLTSFNNQGLKVKVGNHSLDYQPRETEEETRSSLGEFGERLLGKLAEAEYGDEAAKKQAIVNNLLSGFSPIVITNECIKKKQTLGCENLEYTLNSSHWSASINTQYVTQTIRYVVKETSPDDKLERFSVVTVKNSIPLDIMKLQPNELEESFSGVESHVVWSQSFATEQEANEYMKQTQDEVEKDSYVANLQANFPVNIKDRGSELVRDLLTDKGRGTMVDMFPGSNFKVPSYIQGDLGRRDQLMIYVEGENQTPTYCKRKEDQSQLQDQNLEHFSTDIINQMTQKVSPDAPEQALNILQNIYCLSSQNSFLDELYQIYPPENTASKFSIMTPTQLLDIAQDVNLQSVVTQGAYSKMDATHCSQIKMAIMEVNQEGQLPKYQVAFMQKRAPLEVMKKSYEGLTAMDHDQEGKPKLPELESRTAISKLFNTPQEALAYYNQMEALAIEGKLPGD